MMMTWSITRGHRPQTILLPDVTGARAEALFAAQVDQTPVKQGDEVLPAGGGNIAGHAEGAGDMIHSPARRHRPCDARDSTCVSRYGRRIGRHHRKAVARRNEDTATEDHVPVAVAVGSGPEIGRVASEHGLQQGARVCRVRVGLQTAEVGSWQAVDHGSAGRAQPPHKDFLRA